MDFYSAGDFGRDRLSQLHAEAREWNLAKRAEAGERARRSLTFRPASTPGGTWSGALRYGLGTLSAIVTALTSLVR